MDLSILIPARNEMFLGNTVADIFKHSEAETEVIVVLDGEWPYETLQIDPRLTIIYHPESVGQRAATNEAARIARAPVVAKVDAHCSFDQGFDRKLLEDMQPDWTMVPVMHNLHAFNWVCDSCGAERYQGRTPTECWAKGCLGQQFHRKMIWMPRPSPATSAMRIDETGHFQYWSRYKRRQKGDLVETMSIIGAFFMISKDRYFDLNICDEAHGSWGQQGTEVACKTWLSGGRLICSKKTWFAHMFRTQGGDFGFPYPQKASAVERAREYSRQMWRFDDPDAMPEWDRAIRPFRWMLDKFAPVPGWDQKRERKLTKGIVYYTDNRLDGTAIGLACQNALRAAARKMPIVSVSLKPIDFGTNITLDLERGNLAMFKQILAGLEALDTDVVFFAEHDVLYSPTHFDFTPAADDVYYYNRNVWQVDAKTGHALFYEASRTSGLCANRELLIKHYRERIRRVEAEGFTRRMGYEPGTHRRAERVDDHRAETWKSELPNIDLRHDKNLTKSRWRKDQFRSQRNCRGWLEADEVPGWGQTEGHIQEMLDDLAFPE